MILAYLVICICMVLTMLGVEKILRRNEICDGQKFTLADIQWRRFVAVIVGFALFWALFAYATLSGTNPVSWMGF